MEQETRLKPVREFRAYRRNLPHIELASSVYFITFRTTEGFTLSEEAKDITFESIKFHSGKKYELYACVVMETHVHIILRPLSAQARRPVPPLGRPVPPANKANSKLVGADSAFYSLAQITHSIKSYSANRIQKLLHRNGSAWLDESYDRIVRDDEEYLEKMNYVINNPVKADLVEKPEDYKWLTLKWQIS